MNSHNGLILELAEMLVGREVDTKVIDKALRLICQCFSFDGGMIYEIDQYNYFHLQEHCEYGELNIRESFHIDEIRPSYREFIAAKNITHINKNDNSTIEELEMFDLFHGNSLTVATLVDDRQRISAIAVLRDLDQDEIVSSADSKTLDIALSMLEKYVAIRVYEHRLQFAQTSLGSILDNTGIDIYVNDFYTHEILYINKSMAAPYGGVAKCMGGKCWEVIFEGQTGPCEFCPQQKLLDEEGNPSKIYSWDYERKTDGLWFRVFSAAFRWVDGRLAHVVSSVDITDNKKNEALVRYMANYDSLTKLPNRRMLVNECERRINNAKKGLRGYMLFFDIDGFKEINDRFGHEAGDEFLVQLGEFFTSIPMLNGSIYRNGGDEFVAILDGVVEERTLIDEDIMELSNEIHSRFDKPWNLKNAKPMCNISIGVSCYPDDGDNAEDLLAKADQAMYYVKKTGGAGIHFSSKKH